MARITKEGDTFVRHRFQFEVTEDRRVRQHPLWLRQANYLRELRTKSCRLLHNKIVSLFFGSIMLLESALRKSWLTKHPEPVVMRMLRIGVYRVQSNEDTSCVVNYSNVGRLRKIHLTFILFSGQCYLAPDGLDGQGFEVVFSAVEVFSH